VFWCRFAEGRKALDKKKAPKQLLIISVLRENIARSEKNILCRKKNVVSLQPQNVKNVSCLTD
jgi:hypothetical protein